MERRFDPKQFMSDRLKPILVYVVIIAVVGAVWTLGWARSVDDRTEIGYYPPAEPELYKREMNQSDNTWQPTPPADVNK